MTKTCEWCGDTIEYGGARGTTSRSLWCSCGSYMTDTITIWREWP